MKIKTVEEYISLFEGEAKEYLLDFLKFMNDNFPQLKVKISFSMPLWLFKEKMNEGYIACSLAKNHITIHTFNEAFIDKIFTNYTHLKRGKRCINIPYSEKETYNQIKKLINDYLNETL